MRHKNLIPEPPENKCTDDGWAFLPQSYFSAFLGGLGVFGFGLGGLTGLGLGGLFALGRTILGTLTGEFMFTEFVKLVLGFWNSLKYG